MSTAAPDRAPRALLVTCAHWPDGEPGHDVLDSALAARGLDSRWAAWDDPAVDWADADVVAVRATWDYHTRVMEFLDWAAQVGSALLNGAEVFRWNTDKRYLLDLAGAGLPVVPTTSADTVAQVRAAVAQHGTAVVKPRVGASGLGVEVVDDPTWRPAAAQAGPWVVQPLVDSIRSDGETSVFVLGGRPVSQVHKLPGAGDIRVHEQHGGTSRAVDLAEDAASLAGEAVRSAAGLLGARLDYARVDMMRVDGRLVLSEIELTEPGLYLDLVPGNAEPFAELVAARAADAVRRTP